MFPVPVIACTTFVAYTTAGYLLRLVLRLQTVTINLKHISTGKVKKKKNIRKKPNWVLHFG